MSKARALEPDDNQRRIDDDDVEGHGGRVPKATEDDDVEGHGTRNPRAIDDDVEGHGGRVPKATDDDVEGHGGRVPKATDDDVEGHMMGNPQISRQLAQAREQDIQRSLQNSMRAHEAREASRPHKK
jgi:hypothetical protein